MAENYLAEMEREYVIECCEEKKAELKKLPRKTVNIFKEIFELDFKIYIVRQKIFAVNHLTPFGVFLFELAGSDNEVIENEPQNRKFFDYIVSTDVDFQNMCCVFSKCTKLAAIHRRRQLLDRISELREKRQHFFDQLKNHHSVTTLNVSHFEEPKIKTIDYTFKRTSKLIFCQYCNTFFTHSSRYSSHYRKHRYLEYKKEIKVHLADVTTIKNEDSHLVEGTAETSYLECNDDDNDDDSIPASTSNRSYIQSNRNENAVIQVEHREIVLEIDGHDRVKIAKNRDMELLLRYVNKSSPGYQFQVQDIKRANGYDVGSIEKRCNLYFGLFRPGKNPGKVTVLVTIQPEQLRLTPTTQDAVPSTSTM